MEDNNLNQQCFTDLDYLYTRKSRFAPEEFEPDEDMREGVYEGATILVIGAGGLGCEILVDLAMSGIKNIHIIDLDWIDVTNLNRQFLFRMKDVGQYKSDVAAAFVNEKYPGINVTAYTKPIQDFDEEFYRQF